MTAKCDRQSRLRAQLDYFRQRRTDRRLVNARDWETWPWQTTWEDFKGGSKTHCDGMAPAYCLSTYVWGVRRDRPVSEKRLCIDPHLGDLTFADGKIGTELGVVEVLWKRDGDALDFASDLPPGVTNDLRLRGSGQLNGKPFNGQADALPQGLNVGQVTPSPANSP